MTRESLKDSGEPPEYQGRCSPYSSPIGWAGWILGCGGVSSQPDQALGVPGMRKGSGQRQGGRWEHPEGSNDFLKRAGGRTTCHRRSCCCLDSDIKHQLEHFSANVRVSEEEQPGERLLREGRTDADSHFLLEIGCHDPECDAGAGDHFHHDHVRKEPDPPVGLCQTANTYITQLLKTYETT